MRRAPVCTRAARRSGRRGLQGFQYCNEYWSLTAPKQRAQSRKRLRPFILPTYFSGHSDLDGSKSAIHHDSMSSNEVRGRRTKEYNGARQIGRLAKTANWNSRNELFPNCIGAL